MGRSKQNKSNNQSKDGKHRKETKEERRARLESQEKAREQCLKVLPTVGGVMLVLIIFFGLYVRSIPPKPKPQEIKLTPEQLKQFQQQQQKQPGAGGAVPDFMGVNTETKNAQDVLEGIQNVAAAAGASAETIEL